MTYIELIIATSIVVIVAGITATFLRQTQPASTLSSASLAVTSDIRYASEGSVATQINHQVRFNLGTGNYTLVILENPERIIKTVTLDPALTFTYSSLPQYTAEFNALGAVTQSGTVTLQHSNGIYQTIDIRPSGYVQIR